MAILAASRLTDGGGPSTFTPVAVVVTQNGEQIKIDSKGKSADGNIPVGSTKPLESNTGFTPVATIVTQNGEEIQVDGSGRSATGSVPVGSTKTTGGVVPSGAVNKKLLSTYTDPETGDIVDVYDDRTETIRKKGTKKVDATAAAEALSAQRLANKTSAYDILFREFKANGLESLVQAAKDVIMNEDSDAGRLLALRSSPAYQTRFAANAKRTKNGFKAIDEATYLGLEDKYQ